MFAEPTRRRRGFVLVVTLLLLVLVGALMAIVARQSLARAADAVRMERQLQAKWAAVSIGDALPPRAEAVLDAVDSATVAMVLNLGDGPSRQDVRLVISDESAKVNLNELWRRDPAVFAGALATLSPRADLRFDPRPNPVDAAGEFDNPPPPFESYGQLFDMPSPAALIAGTTDLTIFGDGKLNVARASPAAIAQVTNGILGRGEVERLVALRREQSGIALSMIYDELELPQRDRNRLSPLLSQVSTAQAVWIMPEHGPARLVVIERSPEVGVRRLGFAW